MQGGEKIGYFLLTFNLYQKHVQTILYCLLSREREERERRSNGPSMLSVKSFRYLTRDIHPWSLLCWVNDLTVTQVTDVSLYLVQ